MEKKTDTKFTPGPWVVHQRASMVVVDEDACSVASCGGGNSAPIEEQQANALLIAQAPAMYKELEEIHVFFMSMARISGDASKSWQISADSIHRILAAARGEKPDTHEG